MQDFQNAYQDMTTTAVVLTSLSGLFVLLRLILRLFIIRSPGWDDLTIALAVVATFGYLAELIVAGPNGMDIPSTSLTTEKTAEFMKIVVSIEMTYYLIVGLVKISILFAYLRFALKPSFRKACYGTIAFEVVFSVVCLIATSAQCVPLSKLWDFAGTETGTCFSYIEAFFYTTSGINIITDICILVLPMRTLASIKRPTREKIALIAIFGVGAFATIVSIIRLYSIRVFTVSKDPFHDSVPINRWSMIEINTAILCASVSSLKPLLNPSRLRKEFSSRRHGHELGLLVSPGPAEPQAAYDSLGGETQINSPGVITSLDRLIWEDRGPPATEIGGCEMGLKSPAPALIKQEASWSEPHSKGG